MFDLRVDLAILATQTSSLPGTEGSTCRKSRKPKRASVREPMAVWWWVMRWAWGIHPVQLVTNGGVNMKMVWFFKALIHQWFQMKFVWKYQCTLNNCSNHTYVCQPVNLFTLRQFACQDSSWNQLQTKKTIGHKEKDGNGRCHLTLHCFGFQPSNGGTQHLQQEMSSFGNQRP